MDIDFCDDFYINGVKINKPGDEDTHSDGSDLFSDSDDVTTTQDITAAPNENSESLNLRTIKNQSIFIKLSKSTLHPPQSLKSLRTKLLRVEYPGSVKNLDDVIATLGGLKTIETTLGATNARFELKFRPDDFYAKPCYGDRDFNNGLLVKITTRIAKSEKETQTSSRVEHQTTYTYELIGVTNMNVEFKRMCDFQYLPLVPLEEENSKSNCINVNDTLMPKKLPTLPWIVKSKFRKTLPLFLPPHTFSTHDSCDDLSFCFTSASQSEAPIETVPIPAKRKKQVTVRTHTIFVHFTKTKDVPLEPSTSATELIKRRKLDEVVSTVSHLFEDRPIWSKSAVAHKCKLSFDVLKYVLPGVAFYMSTGPWKTLWIRYGYDPRKIPAARIYQVLDYRIRASEGLKIRIQGKRRIDQFLTKATPFQPKRFTLKECKIRPKIIVSERNYVFRPDVLPAARQLFYQYCDILIPEVQEMLARLPEVSKNTKCNIKRGWFPNGFEEQCRELVNKCVTNLVRLHCVKDFERKRRITHARLEAMDVEPSPEVITIDEEIEDTLQTIENSVTDAQQEINQPQTSQGDRG